MVPSPVHPPRQGSCDRHVPAGPLQSPFPDRLSPWAPREAPEGKGPPGSTSTVRHGGPPGSVGQDDLAHPRAHGHQKLVLKEPPLQGVSLAPLPGPVPQRPHAGPGPTTATTASRGGPRGGAAQVQLPQLLLWGEKGPWGSWPGSAAGRPCAHPHHPPLLLGARVGWGWETRRVLGIRVVLAAWGAASGTKWPRWSERLQRCLQGPRVDVPTLTDHGRLLLLGTRTAPCPDPNVPRTCALGRWETLFGVW